MSLTDDIMHSMAALGLRQRYEARRLPARYPGERIEWWGVWDTQCDRPVAYGSFSSRREAEEAAWRHNYAYERAQS